MDIKNRKNGLRRIFFSTFREQKERLGIIGIGLIGNAMLVHFFDYLLYPYAVIKYGMLIGGFFMAAASFFFCWLFILFYDWSKKDWLGVEMLKEARYYNGKSKLRRRIAYVMRRSDTLSIIFLSFNFDPFFVTAYMRRGINKFNGMSGRDWKIFIASWALSNAYWTMAIFYGTSVVMRYGNEFLDIFGIALEVFVFLVAATVLFKKRLILITSRLERHFSWLAGSGWSKICLRCASESLIWAVFIYVVFLIVGDRYGVRLPLGFSGF